jgi:hypothetical protein
MVVMESLQASPSLPALYSFQLSLANVNHLKVFVTSEGCNCQYAHSHVQNGWMTGGQV